MNLAEEPEKLRRERELGTPQFVADRAFDVIPVLRPAAAGQPRPETRHIANRANFRAAGGGQRLGIPAVVGPLAQDEVIDMAGPIEIPLLLEDRARVRHAPHGMGVQMRVAAEGARLRIDPQFGLVLLAAGQEAFGHRFGELQGFGVAGRLGVADARFDDEGVIPAVIGTPTFAEPLAVLVGASPG